MVGFPGGRHSYRDSLHRDCPLRAGASGASAAQVPRAREQPARARLHGHRAGTGRGPRRPHRARQPLDHHPRRGSDRHRARATERQGNQLVSRRPDAGVERRSQRRGGPVRDRHCIGSHAGPHRAPRPRIAAGLVPGWTAACVPAHRAGDPRGRNPPAGARHGGGGRGATGPNDGPRACAWRVRAHSTRHGSAVVGRRIRGARCTTRG